MRADGPAPYDIPDLLLLPVQDRAQMIEVSHGFTPVSQVGFMGLKKAIARPGRRLFGTFTRNDKCLFVLETRLIPDGSRADVYFEIRRAPAHLQIGRYLRELLTGIALPIATNVSTDPSGFSNATGAVGSFSRFISRSNPPTRQL